jgi:hypothetical protein
VCAAFLGNGAAAFFGVAIIEALISPAVKLFTHSAVSIVTREWICSIAVAAAIGTLVRRSQGPSMARWVWIPGLLWFLYGLAGGTGYQIDNRWGTFSGTACAEVRGLPCTIFWAFSVPLIRTASYSVAASISGGVRKGSTLSRVLAGLFLIGPPSNYNQPHNEPVDPGKGPGKHE